MSIDLHCHTTASDGKLAPHQLLNAAKENGVTYLAITDHDTIAAHEFIAESGDTKGINLITGTEISCTWASREIHVIALNFPINSCSMKKTMKNQHQYRWNRSELIANKLSKRISYTSESKLLDEIIEIAQNIQSSADENFVLDHSQLQLGRPHFANWLVQQNIVSNFKQAFKKFIGDAHLGQIKTSWDSLEKTVLNILDCNGIPVLAHPEKYGLTRIKLNALVADFVRAGGLALEVIGWQQPSGQIDHLMQLCDNYKLRASVGSDFHFTHKGRSGPGLIKNLPPNSRPVWELFN